MRSRAAATTESELEKRRFDRDKQCLFRPSGGRKGKIRTFASSDAARDPFGVADEHTPIRQLQLLCFSLRSRSVDTKLLSRFQRRAAATRSINRTSRRLQPVHPRFSSDAIDSHRPRLPRIAIALDNVIPVAPPPRGDKDDALKLLSAAQHTTAKRALLICRDHCAAAALFGNISGTAAYSAGTKRMSLRL